MEETNKIKIYPIKLKEHLFLYIKNYDNNGYFDFWAKQNCRKGQDCESICSVLDNIKGKFDGENELYRKYRGLIMAYIYENDGRLRSPFGTRILWYLTG